MDLSELTKMTEAQARAFLEEIRWPAGPVCPHCGGIDDSYALGGGATRPGVWKCARCRKQYTVSVGTVMHGSHIPLRKWVVAFHLMSSSKKGISALQLQRALGLRGYKSAWHLAHRIRGAMQEGSMGFLKGTVEVDETYIGGKPRKENKRGPETQEPNKKKVKRGRGTTKTPVLALVERDGSIVAKPVDHVDAKTLKGAIREIFDKNSCIIPDEWASYQGLAKEFKDHKMVNHTNDELAEDNAWTNSVESYFALLKRGVHDASHHVSKKHPHRYCNEFSFRWNRRTIKDGERTVCIIQGVGGKRLTYKPIIGFRN